MFGLLYFAQGAVMSYFTALNALYLRSFNISMTQIGLISALALLSDRVNLLRLQCFLS